MLIGNIGALFLVLSSRQEHCFCCLDEFGVFGVSICELTKGIPYVFEALMMWDIKMLQKLVMVFFGWARQMDLETLNESALCS